MDLSNISDIGLFIGVIALFIIVHELGHFVVSKLLNIEVEEFGLGYPPRILTLFTLKETQYTLNWIPLGGFVRPKGENNPDVPGGLSAASPWTRLAVFLAGPVANFLAAVILFTLVFNRVGVPDQSRILILDVAADSPAETAGLKAGDIISEINDQPIGSAQDLQKTIADNLGQEIHLVYLRGEQTGTVDLIPRVNPPPPEGAIGITFGYPQVAASPLQSLGMGLLTVYDQAMSILTLPARLIEGSIAPQDARLLGYKGMYDLYQNVRQNDSAPGAPAGVNTMAFFAIISTSLGLLNLLPIPALDGGRILFALPEILFRRRIPPQYENAINLISFMVLILLMIYINIQDFVNPIQFR